MTKSYFKSLLSESANAPETIHGIYNWCDCWCERCSQTEHCTVYKTSNQLPSEDLDDLFKSLSMVFEATVEMLKEHSQKMGIDLDSLNDSDYTNDYEVQKYLIRNDDGLLCGLEECVGVLLLSGFIIGQCQHISVVTGFGNPFAVLFCCCLSGWVAVVK